MAADPYNHLYFARLERTEVNGEVIETRLIVFKDSDQIRPNEGAEYVTVKTKIDLFDQES